MRAGIALLALSLSSQVHAAEPAALIGQIEGVYKHRFESGYVTGPGQPDAHHQVEDIIEVVRYDDSNVYLNVKLEFYNGHQCGIAGIASHEGGEFVYRAPSIVPGEPECALRLGVRGDRLFLTDRAAPGEASSCRGYCGVRGSLGDYSIARSSKRKIRYMDRLKASPNYRRAVEEHEKKGVKPS
jgi:hypothetical protein